MFRSALVLPREWARVGWRLLLVCCSFALVACHKDVGAKACSPDNCTGCCSSSGECLSGADSSACGTGGAVCAACTADQQCVGATCVTQTHGPSNGGYGETCDSAVPVTLENGRATVLGSSLGATNDLQGSCGGAGGDVVYSLETEAVGPLLVRVRPLTAFQPVLYLRKTCTDGSTEPTGACAATAVAGGATELAIPSLEAGTWSIVVDAVGDGNQFALDIDTRPNGASCANAVPLVLAGSAAFIAGSFASASDSSSASCAAAGATALHTLTSEVPFGLKLSAKATTGSVAVAVRGDCASAASELGCQQVASGSASLDLLGLAPGTYTIAVQGAAGSTSAYTLEVEMTVAPDGDTCATAVALPWSTHGPDSVATVADDTSEYAANMSGTCGGAGRDVAYFIDAPEGGDLTVTLDNVSGFDPVLYLRAGCGGGELKCVDSAGVSHGETLRVPGLAPGEYILVVDSYDGQAGSFTLTAKLSETVPGSSCQSPEPLEFPTAGHGRVSVTGSTAVFEDNSRGTCTTMAGPEAVYSFTLDRPLDFRATVTPDSTSSFDPVLYLRAGDCPGRELTCADRNGWNTGESLALNHLPAGHYLLYVDSYGGGGSFKLDVTLRSQEDQQPGQTCAAPLPLEFQPDGDGLRAQPSALDLRDFLHSASTSCSGNGPSMVYSFHNAMEADFAASVQAIGSGYQPAVALFQATTDCTGLEYICHAAPFTGDYSLSVGAIGMNGLPEGDYFIVVSSADAATGAVQLDARLTPHPVAVEGDACLMPLDLPLEDSTTSAGTKEASISGDLSELANDSTASCGGGAGPDAVYAFTLTEPMTLMAAIASDDSPGFVPVLALRTEENCDWGDDVTCGVGYASTTQINAVALEPGSYRLIVDSQTDVGGPFSLHVTLSPPATGQVCSAPFTLESDGNETGDTSAFQNASEGSCGGAGPEVVYRVEIGPGPASLRATATAASSSSLQPVLYLRSGECGDTEVMCAPPSRTTSGASSIATGFLPEGSYDLFLDGAQAGQGGTYSLSVVTAAPLAGDTCHNAVAILPAHTGSVELNGSTRGLFHDTSGDCGGLGPDLVYAFHTDAPQHFRAAVVPQGAVFQPVLYLRRASENCRGYDEQCDVSGSPGETASLSEEPLPPGDWLLFVDGYGGSAGDFRLNASLAPLGAGETCESPATLWPSAPAFGHATVSGNTSAYPDTAGSELDSCGFWGPDGRPASTDLTGPTTVYGFETNRVLSLRAKVAPNGSGTYQPSVVLWQNACNDETWGCGNADGPGSAAQLEVGELPAGQSILLVSGVQGSEGPFALDATLSEPLAGEGPLSAETLTLRPTAHGSAAHVSATTEGYIDDFWWGSAQGPAWACGGGGADRFYKLTLGSTSLVSAKVTSLSGAYVPAVHLCHDTQNCSCFPAAAHSSSAQTPLQQLESGDYFVIVDGQGTSGAFDLDVVAQAPLAGDLCTGAASAGGPIDLGSFGATGGMVSRNGSLEGDTNQVEICGGTGPDAIYTFQTTETLDLTATFAMAGSPILWLGEDPCSEYRPLCSNSHNEAGAPRIVSKALPPGRYYLVLDSQTPQVATYSLTVAFTPPAPGETCDAPQALQFHDVSGTPTAFVSASTVGFQSVSEASCGGTGPEIIYSLHLDHTSDVVASVTPTLEASTEPFRPVVYLRTACDGSDLACVAAAQPVSWGGIGDPPLPAATVQAAGLTAGTYFLFVDGYATSSGGSFELEATVTPSIEGSSCATPKVVQASATGVVEEGDTRDLLAATAGSCGGTGPEMIYSVVLTAPGTIHAEVQPTSSVFAPLLYARSACSEVPVLACSATDAPALTLTNQPAGTYYLIVDSNDSGGAFQLSVSVTP